MQPEEQYEERYTPPVKKVKKEDREREFRRNILNEENLDIFRNKLGARGIVVVMNFANQCKQYDRKGNKELSFNDFKEIINNAKVIMSDDEIDEPILNRVAGTQPSIIYRKGHMGRYTVVDFNSWGIEINLEKQLPDNAALALMNRLQNPKKIGLYCKDNNYTSHVDLTCYSIPYESIHFNLETSFFTFLRDLSVQYLDF